MSSTAEIAELHDLIGGLRRCVMSLKSRYGEVPGMRRIVLDAERILSDVELLDIDANELDLERWATQHTAEKIPIPDTEYDTEFWRDVDDEGVGGQGRS
ncbi:hypothetical protein [Mycobacterium talmoniae]|uniref:Uncharacterized protein n=1 Tax=Mycobacterium talmoniae TaxID=1858794 RepID=A0A1S1NQB8_9MYCO|nr:MULTISPECIES: hypothetical protein [Mycobacterium]OHV06550.1 hypothetical protein BKN37_01970 [Mycobacterium talmoniae]PQM46181.1 hypothetical protein C1Y40_03644 [Mycobacterium talmoniae]TDH56074.1 hypothetical protein E2F47_08335 [Mycobacterium eburneum]